MDPDNNTMLVTANQFKKLISADSYPTQNHTYYTYTVNNGQNSLVFFTQSSELTIVPHQLQLSNKWNKTNNENLSKQLKQISCSEYNKKLNNYIMIAIHIPYDFDLYHFTPIKYRYKSKSSQKIEQILKMIKKDYENFLQQWRHIINVQSDSKYQHFSQNCIFTFCIEVQAILDQSRQKKKKNFIEQNIITHKLKQLPIGIFSIQNLSSEKNCRILTELLEERFKNSPDMQIFNKLHNSKLITSSLPRKLWNPHLFSKFPDKGEKYQTYFTKGVYEYYHYGDQNFSDMGWGCMYRSTQTLLSWLHLQELTYIPEMPTINQMQKLIDTIDRSRKLSNTQQWIGATQASWIVNRVAGLNCKILHIKDGKQILEHCEQIRQHFEKVGSPIAYGGGQYAYSIVGINYSWKLGQCQFLILDPHYIGSDDIGNIQQKKGLCWRKAEQMFKKGVFYNFCLPLL